MLTGTIERTVDVASAMDRKWHRCRKCRCLIDYTMTAEEWREIRGLCDDCAEEEC